MLNLKKPMMLRNGERVRVVATDIAGDYPLVIAVTNAAGLEWVELRREGGRLFSAQDNERDLVNVPEKVVGYANVWETHAGFRYLGGMHRTAGYADGAAKRHTEGHKRIGRIRIEVDADVARWDD